MLDRKLDAFAFGLLVDACRLPARVVARALAFATNVLTSQNSIVHVCLFRKDASGLIFTLLVSIVGAVLTALLLNAQYRVTSHI